MARAKVKTAVPKVVLSEDQGEDPVIHAPEWYALAAPPRMFFHPLVHNMGDGYVIIYLGDINGFRAVLWHYAEGNTEFIWGCCGFHSEAKARGHFTIDNISNTSGAHRPHAIRLIDWIAEICKHRGWTW